MGLALTLQRIGNRCPLPVLNRWTALSFIIIIVCIVRREPWPQAHVGAAFVVMANPLFSDIRR
jgi:hypothetical protein